MIRVIGQNFRAYFSKVIFSDKPMNPINISIAPCGISRAILKLISKANGQPSLVTRAANKPTTSNQKMRFASLFCRIPPDAYSVLNDERMRCKVMSFSLRPK